MQTFLPYPDFKQSLECLDTKRLGKQRLEARQILISLEKGIGAPWYNHPAVRMWKGYENALRCYHNTAILAWVERGYRNTMELYSLLSSEVELPEWLGNLDFHASHRSNLLRKNPSWYGKFKWEESSNMGYVWPVPPL